MWQPLTFAADIFATNEFLNAAQQLLPGTTPLQSGSRTTAKCEVPSLKSKMLWLSFSPGGLQNVPSLIRTDVCGIWNMSLRSSDGESYTFTWSSCWATASFRKFAGIWLFFASDIEGQGVRNRRNRWTCLHSVSGAGTRLCRGTCDVSSARIWNTCIIYAKCRTSERGGAILQGFALGCAQYEESHSLLLNSLMKDRSSSVNLRLSHQLNYRVASSM